MAGPTDSNVQTVQRLLRGFLHEHTLLSEQHTQLFQTASAVHALIDLLIDKGVLTMEEVATQLTRVQPRLMQSDLGKGLGVVLATDGSDKYEAPAAAVDCEARLPLCRGACCALDVPLAAQDIEEGALLWDPARPYFLQRAAGGRCIHQDADSAGCTVYAQRPRLCRTYSCAADSRIWLDFEGRVPNTATIDQLLSRSNRPSFAGADMETMAPIEAGALTRHTKARRDPR